MTTISTDRVTVRYFAAAGAAAGVDEETIEITAPSTVQLVLDESTRRHGEALAVVLARCSFLLDEVVVHGVDTPVRAGQAIDILPPFAGG